MATLSSPSLLKIGQIIQLSSTLASTVASLSSSSSSSSCSLTSEIRARCPICGEAPPADIPRYCLHVINCAAKTLEKQLQSSSSSSSSPSSSSSTSSVILGRNEDAQEEEEEDEKKKQKRTTRTSSRSTLKRKAVGTPPRSPKRSKGKKAEEEEEEEEEEEQEEDDILLSPSAPSSPAPSSSSSVVLTQEQYDAYLAQVKEGRFKRTGPWKGFNSPIAHECLDDDCKRTWKPSPAQCMPDDYYCPSCVLHHRNNVERFKQDRLQWSSHVPNTFYVFSLLDPNKPRSRLIKFGRTQHEDAWKRYPTSERKEFQMKLVLQLRGRLETMTRIENWWKSTAQDKDLFQRFSVASFHGLSECINVDDKALEEMLSESKKQHLADADEYVKWTQNFKTKRESILAMKKTE